MLSREMQESQPRTNPDRECEHWRWEAHRLRAQLADDALRWNSEVIRLRAIEQKASNDARHQVAYSEYHAMEVADSKAGAHIRAARIDALQMRARLETSEREIANSEATLAKVNVGEERLRALVVQQLKMMQERDTRISSLESSQWKLRSENDELRSELLEATEMLERIVEKKAASSPSGRAESPGGRALSPGARRSTAPERPLPLSRGGSLLSPPPTEKPSRMTNRSASTIF